MYERIVMENVDSKFGLCFRKKFPRVQSNFLKKYIRIVIVLKGTYQ